MQGTTTRIDARVVALDVTANYWIDEQDRPLIERIDDVFLYDKSERTHCCEWTPSYYLIYLYTSILCREAMDEHRRDELDQKYAHIATDNCYVHCHQIDVIEDQAERSRYYKHGDPGFEKCRDEFDSEEAWHDAVMEALREHFCANWPL
jgi:hypothetical protein